MNNLEAAPSVLSLGNQDRLTLHNTALLPTIHHNVHVQFADCSVLPESTLRNKFTVPHQAAVPQWAESWALFALGGGSTVTLFAFMQLALTPNEPNHITVSSSICDCFYSLTKDVLSLVEVCCQTVSQWELMVNLRYCNSLCLTGGCF